MGLWQLRQQITRGHPGTLDQDARRRGGNRAAGKVLLESKKSAESIAKLIQELGYYGPSPALSAEPAIPLNLQFLRALSPWDNWWTFGGHYLS